MNTVLSSTPYERLSSLSSRLEHWLGEASSAGPHTAERAAGAKSSLSNLLSSIQRMDSLARAIFDELALFQACCFQNHLSSLYLSWARPSSVYIDQARRELVGQALMQTKLKLEEWLSVELTHHEEVLEKSLFLAREFELHELIQGAVERVEQWKLADYPVDIERLSQNFISTVSVSSKKHLQIEGHKRSHASSHVDQTSRGSQTEGSDTPEIWLKLFGRLQRETLHLFALLCLVERGAGSKGNECLKIRMRWLEQQIFPTFSPPTLFKGPGPAVMIGDLQLGPLSRETFSTSKNAPKRSPTFGDDFARDDFIIGEGELTELEAFLHQPFSGDFFD